MSAQVAADLRAAADVLERDGWTQGEYEQPDGCKCISGALRSVCGGIDTTDTDRYLSAWYALRPVIGRGAINWNDEPGRTADEVIAALRTAADAAEAQS